MAETVTITCDEAKTAARSDSVKLVKYEVDTASGKGKLDCAIPRNGYFCQSIRMDVSRFLNSANLDGCRDGAEETRLSYQFLITQEDEFDNFVTLYMYKSCKTGKIERDELEAVVTSNQSSELPDTSEVVKCRVQK